MDAKKTRSPGKKGKSDKIHLEIAPGNWKRIEAYLVRYNASPTRMTPKFKIADVVNEALLEFLASRGSETSRG